MVRFGGKRMGRWEKEEGDGKEGEWLGLEVNVWSNYVPG